MKILLVEDNLAYVSFVTEVFKWKSENNGEQYELHEASDLASALDFLKENTVDAILLDLQLGDSDSMDTIVKTKQQSPDIPIIVLTCTNDESVALESLKHGAQDYLMKDNLDFEAIFRSITYSIERNKFIVSTKKES